jgi:AbrB family looped-hinge helix DNA binding protein
MAWLAIEQGLNPCYSKDVSKVTSKLQLTVPKAIADQYGIRPGDELQWRVGGEAIHVIPAKQSHLAEQARTIEERLELFDQATRRQRLRQRKARKALSRVSDRGWKREELYGRPVDG